MRFARRLVVTVFALHLVAAIVSFIGMDEGLGTPALDRVSNGIIDAYEAVGFGIYPVGIAIVTAALAIVYYKVSVGLRAHSGGRSVSKTQ